jgi:hypothetical protein
MPGSAAEALEGNKGRRQWGLHHESSVNTTQGVGLHRKTKMITEAEK